MPPDVRSRLTTAARDCLTQDGYAALSTRRVADRAGVPLSQIHYHFGGRQGLVLAVLEEENARLVERQRRLYAADAPLSQRYAQACDVLEEDLDSGYVRVLQEMIAAGWSDPAVATAVSAMLAEWFALLTAVLTEAERELGPLSPIGPTSTATLVGLSFLGAESLLLLGDPRWGSTARDALRAVGRLIERAERT